MPDSDGFDLSEFLPYLLNRAAEEAAIGFSRVYKARYGMLRTEWRVLAHLGRRGAMTASEISAAAGVHKTKISRAVRALETRRFLTRQSAEDDRRRELLSLTAAGQAAYVDLTESALAYDRNLAGQFSPEEEATLRICLRRLAKLGPDVQPSGRERS